MPLFIPNQSGGGALLPPAFAISGTSPTVTPTTDPTSSNDVTQGFQPGMIWINTTALRAWLCLANTQGAAQWMFMGAAYGQGGFEPASVVTQAGSSTATFPEEGNVNRQTSLTGISPGATGADNVLAAFTLPANAFDIANRGVQISASGKFGATANNKTVRIQFNPATAVVGSTIGAGATIVADTGVVATNGGGWSLQANIFKVGAAGSNTQIAIHNQAQVGAAVSALLAPSAPVAVESGGILIAVTGNAATATSDIVFQWMEVNWMN